MHEEDVKRLSEDLESRITKSIQLVLMEWETFPPDEVLNCLGKIRATVIRDYMHEDRPRANQLKLEDSSKDKLSTDEDYEPSDEDVEDD